MELSILQWVHATFHSVNWLNYTMEAITYLGSFGAICIFTALTFILFAKTRRAGVCVAIALAAEYVVVSLIIKKIIGRPRVWETYGGFDDFYSSIGLILPSDSSFPSGHAASCFCTATVLAYFYGLKSVPAFIIATFVSLSRIYLCVHYPSDVICGIMIGIVVGAAVIIIYNLMLKSGKIKGDG